MYNNYRIYIIDGDKQFIEDIRSQTFLHPEYELIGSAGLITTAEEHLNTMSPDILIVSENVETPLSDTLAFMRRVPAKHKLLLLNKRREGEEYPYPIVVRPYTGESVFETLEDMTSVTAKPIPDESPAFSETEDPDNAFAKARAAIEDDGFTPPYVRREEGLRSSIARREAEAMQRTVQSVQNVNNQPRRKKRQLILTVYSPKGGVGKTSLSKELAACYALSTVGGRRLRVLLCDFNLDFSDVSTMLDISPGMKTSATWAKDIEERLKRGESPKSIIYSPEEIEKRFLVKKRKDSPGGQYLQNLWVLAGPTNHLDSAYITEEQLEIMVENLRSCNFDIIIFDTGNNTRNSSFIALERADYVLLIATQEVATANDLASFLNVINRIDFDVSKVRLIVNQIRPTKLMKISVEDVKANFTYPCVAEIRDFPALAGYNNLGMPAVLDGDSEFAKSIQGLASRIVRVSTPGSGRTAEKEEKKGLFARLFGK